MSTKGPCRSKTRLESICEAMEDFALYTIFEGADEESGGSRVSTPCVPLGPSHKAAVGRASLDTTITCDAPLGKADEAGALPSSIAAEGADEEKGAQGAQQPDVDAVADGSVHPDVYSSGYVYLSFFLGGGVAQALRTLLLRLPGGGAPEEIRAFSETPAGPSSEKISHAAPGGMAVLWYLNGIKVAYWLLLVLAVSCYTLLEEEGLCPRTGLDQ